MPFFIGIHNTCVEEGIDTTNMAQPGFVIYKTITILQVINRKDGDNPKNITTILHCTIKLISDTENLTYHPSFKL